MKHDAQQIELETDPKRLNQTENGDVEIQYDQDTSEKLENDGVIINTAMQILSKSFQSKEKHHCDVCGGLLPELWIVFGDRRYLFTCYEIQSTKSGKVLKKTDYGKMAHYAKVKEEKVKKK